MQNPLWNVSKDIFLGFLYMNPITSTGDSTPKYHPEILGFTGAHEDCREEGTANHVCWKACPAVQVRAQVLEHA